MTEQWLVPINGGHEHENTLDQATLGAPAYTRWDVDRARYYNVKRMDPPWEFFCFS
jgi:hypothetical protein